jgi:hypothetical protein
MNAACNRLVLGCGLGELGPLQVGICGGTIETPQGSHDLGLLPIAIATGSALATGYRCPRWG